MYHKVNFLNKHLLHWSNYLVSLGPQAVPLQSPSSSPVSAANSSHSWKGRKGLRGEAWTCCGLINPLLKCSWQVCGCPRWLWPLPMSPSCKQSNSKGGWETRHFPGFGKTEITHHRSGASCLPVFIVPQFPAPEMEERAVLYRPGWMLQI